MVDKLLVSDWTPTLFDQGGGVLGIQDFSEGGSAALAWEGSLADKGTLTITTDGTFNFTAKTNAAPMYLWDSRDSSINSSRFSRRSFDASNSGILTLDAAIPADSHSLGALRYDYDQYPDFSNGSMSAEFLIDLDGAGETTTLFSKRRANFDGLDAYSKWQELDSGGSAWNQKLWRWWGDSDGTFNTDSVTVAQGTNTSHGDPRITTENKVAFTVNPTTNKENFGMGNKDLWKTDFIRGKETTAQDATDGFFKWVCEGVGYSWLGTDATPYITKKSEANWNNNDYRRWFWPQGQFIYTDLAWSMWVDTFYVDDTLHSVFITDSATWDEAAGDVYEIQIPITWTTTTITVNLRLGEFSGFSGKYLYILDDTGIPVTTTGVAL